MCTVQEALYHDSAFVKYYHMMLCTWEGKSILLKLPDEGKEVTQHIVWLWIHRCVYTSINMTKHWVEHVECVLKLCTCRTCTCIYVQTTISATYMQTTALYIIYFVSQPTQQLLRPSWAQTTLSRHYGGCPRTYIVAGQRRVV